MSRLPPSQAAASSATGVGDDRVRFSVHATTTPAALDAAVTVLTAGGTPPDTEKG